MKQLPAQRHPLQPTLRRHALAIALGAIGAAGLLPAAALAQTAPALQAAAARSYNIGAGPLDEVLNRFGRESGIMLAFGADSAAGLRSPGLQGSHTVPSGFGVLLAGSGLEAVRQANGSYLLRKLAPAPRETAVLGEIQVRALADNLPPAYAGGQVASGTRVGMLGNLNLMDTPFNITGYTRELIENQQARGLMDVLENDPSVRSSSPIDSEADIMMVRGFEMFGREVMINGMAGLADNRGQTLEAVERVEVMKGPSALLNGVSPWGSSTGGSINYVLKRGTDEPVARFTGSFAASSQLGGHLDLGRRFGDRKQWGARLNTAYRSGDGAIDHTNNKIGLAALALDYRGERLRANLDLSYQKKDLSGGVGASRIGSSVAIPRPPKASSNFKQPWETFVSDNTFGSFGIEYDLSPNWTIGATHGQSTSDEAYLLTIHSISNINGDLSGTPYFIPGRSTNNSGGLTLRGKFDTGPLKHTLAVVADDNRSRRGQNNLSVAGGGVPSNLYNPIIYPYRDSGGQSTSVDMTALYQRRSVAVTDSIGLFDERVLLMLGARKQTVDNSSFSVNPATRALTRTFRYTQDKITPAAGLVFKANRELSLYASYIESLNPGPTPSATYYANGNQVFPPFPSKQYETGLKFDRGSFGLTTSLFQINLQSTLEVPGATATALPTLELNGEQRNRGAEVNVFGEAMPGLRVLGGVALIDARLLHTQGGLTDGRRARGVPRSNINLGSEWDVPAVPGLTLTGRAVYTSMQYIDTGNTAARSIPSWTRYDAGARFVLRAGGRPVTVRANIDNLFNKDYWSSASRGVVVLGAPRSIRLSASVDL